MSGIRSSRHAQGKLSLKAMSIHFAAVTLVATGLLAMFSEGEKKAAAAEALEQIVPEPDAITKAAHGEGTNGIIVKKYEEFEGGSFGEAAGPKASSGSLSYLEEHEPGYEPEGLPQRSRKVQILPPSLPEGMTLEEWLALHKEKDDDTVPMQLTGTQMKALAPSGQLENATPVGP